MSMNLDAIGIAGTGMATSQKWMDAISDNLANVNDTAAPGAPIFREEFMQASALPGTNGVGNDQVVYGPAGGQLVYDPTDPNANKQGYVEKTTVDLSDQMSDLIMAQRAYQADADAVDRSQSIYQAALQIGSNS